MKCSLMKNWYRRTGAAAAMNVVIEFFWFTISNPHAFIYYTRIKRVMHRGILIDMLYDKEDYPSLELHNK